METTFQATLENVQQDIRVLSLDGGGVRGYLTAEFLRRRAGDRSNDVSWWNEFQLFVGTSVGALIAAVGACQLMSPNALAKLICNEVDHVFDKSIWDVVLDRLQWQAKYDGKGLQALCDRLLGKLTLGEVKTHLIVPVYNLCLRQVWIIDSKDPGLANLLISNVLMAATAAPSYFPQVKVSRWWCIDAGVCVNDPALIALAAAKKYKCPIHIISVGTGRTIKKDTDVDSQSLIGWLGNDIIGILQDETVVPSLVEAFMCNECDTYRRVNYVIGGDSHISDKLDDTSSHNMAAMREEAARLVRQVDNISPR